jgi:hypothetical protein
MPMVVKLGQKVLYEKIGFKLDGDVRPDYYWCKGNRRRHGKSCVVWNTFATG